MTTNLEKVLEAVQDFTEEDWTTFFQKTSPPITAVRYAFYTARDVAELGGYTSHKTILQMACGQSETRRHSPWKTIMIGRGIRLFDKSHALSHLNRLHRLKKTDKN